VIITFFILVVILFLVFSLSTFWKMKDKFMPGMPSFHSYSSQLKKVIFQFLFENFKFTLLTVTTSIWMFIYSGLLSYDSYYLFTTGDFHDSTPFGDPLLLLYIYRICEVWPVITLAYMLKDFVKNVDELGETSPFLLRSSKSLSNM
jgi:hypothetical protein